MINFVCVCFRGAGWAALKYSIARRVGLQKTLVGCSRLLTSEMLLARGSPSSTAVVVDFDMALVQVAQGRHLSYLGKTPLQLLVEQVRSDIVGELPNPPHGGMSLSSSMSMSWSSAAPLCH